MGRVLERLSVATNSTDLTMSADRRSDVDYLCALGIAAIRNGNVAGPLARLHSTTSRVSIREAAVRVEALARRFNAKLNWRLGGEALRIISERALAHHIAPVCPHCSGRRFEMQEGTPVLSNRPCRHCHASGKRPVQKKYRDQITKMISALENIDSRTDRAVARLVR